jgi:transcriptional regulator with XRE-family HTH domain
MTAVKDTTQGWVPSADHFGARLALVRNYLQLNIKQAAERAGVDNASWNMWEKGRQPRDLVDKARQISSALGCDFIWLLTGSSEGGKTTPGYPWLYRSLCDPHNPGTPLDVTGLVPAA